MKTVVFAYDFTHWKTQATLVNLMLDGHKPDAIIAAPYRQLTLARSAYSVTPAGRRNVHPKRIAERFDIPYHSVAHDSQECLDILGDGDFDLGIIAGARILKHDVIAQVRKGIVNMHPGMLPDCRGLDTLKWSVVNNLPLGVTLHYIDARVDRGRLIKKEDVPVFFSDALVEVGLRMQHAEQKLLMNFMDRIKDGTCAQDKCEPIAEGTRYGIMPWEKEQYLKLKFVDYKRRRGSSVAL
jgi:phosphoribosylglycinamide formyltransferase-1